LTVTGTATDRVGRKASVTSTPFNIDRTAPTISVTLSPEPNGAFLRTPVTAHFICSDAGSGVASCPDDQVISTEGTNLSVTGRTTDRAGNDASVTSAAFSVDTTPPVALSGLISDLGSGLGRASCNGAPATITGGAFSCVVSLTPGVNTVQASVTDRAGNSSSATLDISYTRVPIITINSPSNLSY